MSKQTIHIPEATEIAVAMPNDEEVVALSQGFVARTCLMENDNGGRWGLSRTAIYTEASMDGFPAFRPKKGATALTTRDNAQKESPRYSKATAANHAIEASKTHLIAYLTKLKREQEATTAAGTYPAGDSVAVATLLDGFAPDGSTSIRLRQYDEGARTTLTEVTTGTLLGMNVKVEVAYMGGSGHATLKTTVSVWQKDSQPYRGCAVGFQWTQTGDDNDWSTRYDFRIGQSSSISRDPFEIAAAIQSTADEMKLLTAVAEAATFPGITVDDGVKGFLDRLTLKAMKYED